MKRTAMRRRYRNTGPDPETREAVGNRAGWRCEICWGYDCLTCDAQVHHRRPRAAGGTVRPDTNLPSNLLYIGAHCHNIVESRRADALASGWLVSQYDDPAKVPVLIHGDRWVYLASTGEYRPDPPGGDHA